MAWDQRNEQQLPFYPAYCFRASPTHFTWVKIAATDIQRLKSRREFGGQNIYFYFNHPIRFVYLVGVVLTHEDYPRRTLLVLDDSSGATIEVVILKKAIVNPDPDGTPQGWNNLQVTAVAAAAAATGTASSSFVGQRGPPLPARQLQPVHNPDTGPEEATETAFDSTTPTSNIQEQLQLPQHISGTTNLPLPDISSLKPGLVIKVKGTLSLFRSTFQIILEKFEILNGNTAAEMRFWDDRSRFLIDVLSVPWSLTPTEISQLRIEYQSEEKRDIESRRRAEERKRRWREREERHRKRILKDWEREEKLRSQEAEKCREESRRFMAALRERDAKSVESREIEV